MTGTAGRSGATVAFGRGAGLGACGGNAGRGATDTGGAPVGAGMASARFAGAAASAGCGFVIMASRWGRGASGAVGGNSCPDPPPACVPPNGARLASGTAPGVAVGDAAVGGDIGTAGFASRATDATAAGIEGRVSPAAGVAVGVEIAGAEIGPAALLFAAGADPCANAAGWRGASLLAGLTGALAGGDALAGGVCGVGAAGGTLLAPEPLPVRARAEEIAAATGARVRSAGRGTVEFGAFSPGAVAATSASDGAASGRAVRAG